jgi:hypothetical protein
LPEALRLEEDSQRKAEVEGARSLLTVARQRAGPFGRCMPFVSLAGCLFDRLRAELAGRGIAASEGDWGYRGSSITNPG